MIPFKTNTVMDYCTEIRLGETLDFVDFPLSGVVGDMGEPNEIAAWVAEAYDSINHTDFNKEIKPAQKYDTVFCFEVIEHLLNPLFFMEQIRKKCLNKGGVVYLSTPVANRFGFMFNESEHFSEYRIDKLKVLFEYAGFKVEKEHQFRAIPFWKEVWRVKSLRSIVRALTTYTVLFKLRKI